VIVPDCPPLDVRFIGIRYTCLLFAAFGLIAEIAVVLALKGWEYVSSIRERRLRALHPPPHRRSP